MYEEIKYIKLTSFGINNATDLNYATTQDILIHSMVYDYANQDNCIKVNALGEVTINKNNSAFYIDLEKVSWIEEILNSKIKALHIYMKYLKIK